MNDMDYPDSFLPAYEDVLAGSRPTPALVREPHSYAGFLEDDDSILRVY